MNPNDPSGQEYEDDDTKFVRVGASTSRVLAHRCVRWFASFLSAPLVGARLAQRPTAAAAAEAAPAAAAEAPPACDAKTLMNCTPNSGDTAWMLTSVALVLMMTVPGLGLFYGGMVRKKNVGDTVMTSFAITCLVTVLFACVTYSLAFTPGTPYIGGLSRAFLQGIVSDIAKGIGNPNPLAPTIPETVYMCFQMTFAIITPALIAGAFAERMKFSAMLWFITLWAISSMRRSPIGCGDRTACCRAPIMMPSSRCSTSPAAPWCMSIPAPPAWCARCASASARIRARPTTWC